MKLYCVGPDEAYDEPGQDDRYEWLVYWYEEGDYCGDGEAVALGKDGKLYTYGLGHCSCYGPFDDWGTFDETVEVEKFLGQKESIHESDWEDAVKDKVRELLNR